MNIVLSAAAIRDLEGIGDWIAKDNPARAVGFVTELRQACEHLAEAPRACALLPGYEGAGIRRRSYGRYLIFYIVGARDIEVIRVLHGARDYEALLFPDAD